jgi:hypothetical protein
MRWKGFFSALCYMQIFFLQMYKRELEVGRRTDGAELRVWGVHDIRFLFLLIVEAYGTWHLGRGDWHEDWERSARLDFMGQV